MGRHKALLTWEGQPLIRYQVEQLLATPVERLVVVLGHRRDDLEPHLPADGRVAVIVNPDYTTGKASSIVAGVAAAPEGHHLCLLGVDQPRPAPVTRRLLVAHAASRAAVSVAGYAGRRGHPVVFSPALRGELLAIDEATSGLRAVLRRHDAGVHVVETGEPLTLVNLNTPEDYTAALLIRSTSSERAGNQ